MGAKKEAEPEVGICTSCDIRTRGQHILHWPSASLNSFDVPANDMLRDVVYEYVLFEDIHAYLYAGHAQAALHLCCTSQPSPLFLEFAGHPQDTGWRSVKVILGGLSNTAVHPSIPQPSHYMAKCDQTTSSTSNLWIILNIVEYHQYHQVIKESFVSNLGNYKHMSII